LWWRANETYNKINILYSVVVALGIITALLAASCSIFTHKKYVIAYINPNPTEFEGA